MVKNKQPGKNDIAWDLIFDKLNILEELNENKIFKITASQIKEISSREPRLMTKFDHKHNLPNIFKENKLAILPDSRGTYIIGKFKAYENLLYTPQKPIKKEIPHYIECFDANNITSESTALNIAHAAGMIDEVLDSNQIKSTLVLTGRMSSRTFNYNIKTDDKIQTINVTNSQIEVDGSYESLEKVGILEAKNRVPEDFLIRQLYYPYRLFKNKAISKEIIPIFFTYADDIFSFHIYKFEDINEYSSIKKIDQYDFILNESIDIKLSEIIAINEQVIIVEESVPFPQADDFIRVLDMINFLDIPKDKFETAEYYEFDERQSDYYFNALRFLGIAERNNENKYKLTEFGYKLQSYRNSKKRNILVISKILEHKVFNSALVHFLKTGGYSEKKYLKSLILEFGFKVESPVTAGRRTSTVISWIRWILSNASD